MFYLGIDIGKNVHFACVVDDKGKLVVKPFSFTVNIAGYQRLLLAIKKIDKQSLHIGFEATGPYWLTLFQYLKSVDLDKISVLNPLQVSSFRNQSIRGIKTDKVDCFLIADILRMGNYVNYRLPSDELLSLRKLSRFRADLVAQLAQLKTKILNILDLVFPEYGKLFNNVFGISSKAILDLACTPEEIAKLNLSKLKSLIKTTSRNHIKPDKALKLKQAAKKSVGIKFSVDTFSMELKFTFEHLKFLEAQIQALETKIKTVFKQQDVRLTSIPGIADVSAATILSEIGDIANFTKQGAKKLVAFAGIDAKVRNSGQHTGKAKMSKRGSRYLRSAIFQSSLVASIHDPLFKGIYQKQINRGKSHRVAISHVANKMTHVIYSVLKNNKPYVCPIEA